MLVLLANIFLMVRWPAFAKQKPLEYFNIYGRTSETLTDICIWYEYMYCTCTTSVTIVYTTRWVHVYQNGTCTIRVIDYSHHSITQQGGYMYSVYQYGTCTVRVIDYSHHSITQQGGYMYSVYQYGTCTVRVIDYSHHSIFGKTGIYMT